MANSRSACWMLYGVGRVVGSPGWLGCGTAFDGRRRGIGLGVSLLTLLVARTRERRTADHGAAIGRGVPRNRGGASRCARYGIHFGGQLSVGVVPGATGD